MPVFDKTNAFRTKENAINALVFAKHPTFLCRTKSEPTVLAVTHIRSDVENNGLTTPIPKEDALLVTLLPLHDRGSWRADRS